MSLAKRMRRSADWLCKAGLLLLVCSPIIAGDRYVAEFQDGTRAEDVEVRNWHDEDAAPQIGGKAIFDSRNPARWIIDREQTSRSIPSAYVEFVGGDRIAGTVIGYRTGQENPYDRQSPHLIFQPSSDLFFPDDRRQSEIRLALAVIERIVWQRTSHEEYRPNTVVLRDGGVVNFRSIRWESDRLKLLTSDGVRDVPWDDLAELHLARLDSWVGYFDQLAALNPTCAARMIQMETAASDRYTVSQTRFCPRHTGDPLRPEGWLQLIQPAWSLDPLWVRFRDVAVWRIFRPDILPLTRIAPEAVIRKSVFGSAWNWQVDRNVQQGQLQSAQFEFAGGFGVQASTELRFSLSPLVRAFRTRAGLDRAAKTGGCVNLTVSVDSDSPLFRVDHLVGSDRVIDTGWLALPSADSDQSRLTLSAEMDHEQRPAGTDPFDIRDIVNWYEPEVQLDLPRLQADVARRSVLRIPGFSGWTLAVEDVDKIQTVPAAVAPGTRRVDFPSKIRVTNQSATFRRQLKIEPQHHWLAAVVSREADAVSPTSVRLRIDGDTIADLDVPTRKGFLEPDPLLVSVDSYHGRTVLVELSLAARGEQAEIECKGISLVADPPGLLQIFEDQEDIVAELRADGDVQIALSTDQPYSGARSFKVSNGVARQGRLSGLNVRITEQPRLGQYRHLVFAWKKAGGDGIFLQLAHEEAFGEQIAQLFPRDERSGRRFLSRGTRGQLEERGLRRGFSYAAGSGSEAMNTALSLDAKAPDQWTLETRDLVADFGAFHLTGLALGCPDGEAAWFDHIYLARTKQDVEILKKQFANTPERGMSVP